MPQEELNPYEHQVVSVPEDIESAKIELVTFLGASAFLGTKLGILYCGNKKIELYSKMSGVVDRVLVDNGEIVKGGQNLFELRNTNINRDKDGNKMHPSKIPTPKPSSVFFRKKKPQTKKKIPLPFLKKYRPY